jgi:hypothetical protein
MLCLWFFYNFSVRIFFLVQIQIILSENFIWRFLPSPLFPCLFPKESLTGKKNLITWIAFRCKKLNYLQFISQIHIRRNQILEHLLLSRRFQIGESEEDIAILRLTIFQKCLKSSNTSSCAGSDQRFDPLMEPKATMVLVGCIFLLFSINIHLLLTLFTLLHLLSFQL